MSNSKDWTKHIKEKYGRDKEYSPTELHEERKKLEKKYGEKIILGKLEDMETDQERMDKIEYESLSKVLQDAIPEMKSLDEKFKTAYNVEKTVKSSFSFLKEAFWVVLGVLLLL